MAKTTSLEQQLVTGMEGAYLHDPKGKIAAAKKGAFDQFTEGIKGVGEAFKTKQEEIDEQNEVNEASWQNIISNMDKNLGSLDQGYWEMATDHAEQNLKPIFDACKDGKPGNRCRKRVEMELNEFVNHTAELKDVMTGYRELEEGFVSGGPNGGPKYDKSNYQTNRQKAILGSLAGKDSNLDNANRSEISELERTIAATTDNKEKRKLNAQLKKLKENKNQEYGWDITYIDQAGNEVSERVGVKDLKDLIPIKDNKIGNDYLDNQQVAKDDNANYKAGVQGSSGFNTNKAEKQSKAAVTPKNLTSAWHDDHGFGAPLVERFKTHPAFIGMSYEDLGLDVAEYDKDNDGEIDETEWPLISEGDIAKVGNVLANPEHPLHKGSLEISRLSLEVAQDDYKNNLWKQSEIDLYGAEYWNEDNLEYPKGTPHVDIMAKQKAIKDDLTTPRQGETPDEFKERNGIMGAVAAKGITWNKQNDSWEKNQVVTTSVYNK